MREQVKEFFKEEIQNYNNFISQVSNDSRGRFFQSKDGRKNHAKNLGKTIYTEEQFIDYLIERIEKKTVQETFLSTDPTIEVLIGVPGSGKSTYLEMFETKFIISRDDIVMSYGGGKYLGGYSEIFKQLTDADQKEIDKLLQRRFHNAIKDKRDIVIDMTNVSNKSQHKWLHDLKGYRKVAIVFATGYDEVYRRLAKRKEETGKAIPDFVIKNMMKGFMVPNFSKFDVLEWVF